VEDACGFELPDGDYETLAGFLLERFGRLPVVGDHLSEQGWRFEVEKLDRRRIARVRVSPPVPGASPADGNGTDVEGGSGADRP
jgi:CBS domain containing-hemolysin-like protein